MENKGQEKKEAVVQNTKEATEIKEMKARAELISKRLLGKFDENLTRRNMEKATADLKRIMNIIRILGEIEKE